MDTSTALGKGIYPIYQQHDRLRFGGYMQPQFQYAQDKGVKNYSGGDFAPNSNNRFMLRRGRIRVDYLHNNEKNQPLAYFAFQFDGTERGVAIRDFWGRFFENKVEMFAVTAGMFARPMGFEANFSSSDREAPERGRMSQILMKTERDIGAMLTFETRRKGHVLRWMKYDIGVFNGQGLAGPADYDSHKDIISRFSVKPRTLKRSGIIISASVSGFYGGIVSQSPLIYRNSKGGGRYSMLSDSLASNTGYVAPRHYIGGDMQIKIPNKKGFSELRAEYIRGLQTGTAATSETPGSYPVAAGSAVAPLYVRQFDGAYFYYIQHLGSTKHLSILKFDWYDPNRLVKGTEVNPTYGYTAADVRYNTLGIGYMRLLNAHTKLTLFYDHIMNESTAISGYTKDLKDNIFTCRVQFRF
ncbi:hypothetical protein GCM10023093_06040 [Nemorincola caseinilytica]|uniref:Porin n=2 Tax=Nemorincola caseinilytica TaxID=2054315 RepID=A0ABP8N9A2_9BACT